MAEIKPFKALLYNKDKISDFSKVTCPPYDIISKNAQEEYYQNSPYNLIRLLLGKQTKKDSPNNNRYTRAKKYFEDWQSHKILIQDEQECFYFHKHTFTLAGKTISRYGIFGLLRLEESVLGHEKTKIEPKKDRLKLIRKVKANLSPVFVLFSDTEKIINKSLKSYVQNKKPFVKFVDHEKNLHYLWRIEDEEIKNKFRENIRKKQIFIADGHHRYAVGLKFALEMRKKSAGATGLEGWNYIMSYFTDMDSKGLIILPVHRLVKSKNKKLKDMLDIFTEYFKIEKIEDRSKFLAYFEKKKEERHCFGFYLRGINSFYILRLKNKEIIKKIFPRHREEFHDLDVFVLEELILKKLLGIKDKAQISYNPDAQKALEAVNSKEADFVFLVSPTKIEDVKRIALIKKHMPPKSTYFYPKVLSGLTIHKFDEDVS